MFFELYGNSMNLFRRKIEEIMRSEEAETPSFPGLILRFLSAVYCALIRIWDVFYLRKIFKQKKLSCRVISIGNITVGGTGKTPMTVFLAGMLKQLGYKVVVVSRGYGGMAGKTGGIVSDGRGILLEPESAGDEPFMMAAGMKNIPVVIGHDRHEAGLLAINKFNPDVIILDDGFQHRRLFRDINLLLLDSKHPFGNGRLVPAGILREPAASIGRADAFILTRSSPGQTETRDAICAVSGHQPFFEAFNSFYYFKVVKGCVSKPLSAFCSAISEDFGCFAGRKIVAFSGIAGNGDFRKTLEEFKCDILEFFGFSDHYRYTEGDMERISKSIRDRGAELVMTTEKDFARMNGKFNFPVDIAVVGVKMRLKDENSFREFILNKL